MQLRNEQERRETIRWEQIDPRITRRVGAYLAGRYPAVGTTPAMARTYPEEVLPGSSTESLGPFWTGVSFVAALFLVFLYLNACFNLTGPVATALLSALPVGIAGICGMAGFVEQGRGLYPARLRGRIPATPVVQGALTQIAATRAELLYGELVKALTIPCERRSDSRLRRDLLRHCNILLRDHFRIEAYRRRVEAVHREGAALERAEAERERLTLRRDRETDTLARQSLEDSLALCEERVSTLRGMKALLVRLEAHDEVICQALSLAQAALTRAEATPVSLAIPDVDGLRETVRRVVNQTRAVEEAVAELTGP